jgi:periplasmic mercuric ion binding protein
MRSFFFILFSVISFFPAANVLAGNHTVTGHFNVNGVCDQCKARIENAVYDVKGVKYADWNVDTHDLTVKYDSTKTSPEVILKSVAVAGHDNEMFKAEDTDYKKIASCCKYRSGLKKH